MISKKQKKQNKNALNNCREKLLNMIPRFSMCKCNLESNSFLAIFQLLILCLLGKVEVVLSCVQGLYFSPRQFAYLCIYAL